MTTEEQQERIEHLEIRILYGKATREEIEECRALRRTFRDALEERLRAALGQLVPEEDPQGTP